MVRSNGFYPPVVINDASRNFLDHESLFMYSLISSDWLYRSKITRTNINDF